MASRKPFPVVGVGASAGGVEALEGLFRPMPADAGMAFVVVTHLGPNQDSMLAEILGRYAKFPVVGIKDNTVLEPNKVFVLTHDAVLTLEGGRLRLRTPIVERRERNPIDVFFGTLAAEIGEHAIGIVLSGGGSDGTLGIKAIKERGGLAIAQGTNHTEPLHSAMPDSAIATGLVDLVLPVQDIAGKLVDYVRSFDGLDKPAGAGVPAADRARSDQARAQIYEALHHHIGHDFSGYKDKTFWRRVERRMQVLQVRDVADYVARLQRDPAEVALLFRDLLISVTSFFRDPEAWAALKRNVIPKLFEGKGASDTVRAWVAGCATGEEVYSLAILLREHMDTLQVQPKMALFATDIDDNALQVARAGRYPATLLEHVSPARLARFFRGDGTSYVIGKELRDACVFSAHSIIRDPPFSRMDLVTCRNLLIYFSGPLQHDVIPVFHYALRKNGYLLLGGSENIARHGELFAPVDTKLRIYQRREPVTPRRLPTMVQGAAAAPRGADGRRPAIAAPPSLRQRIEARVLDRHAPAHVVVNRGGDIVYYSPRTGKYLEAASGVPTRQLIAGSRKELRLALRELLDEAASTRLPIASKTVELEIDQQTQLVQLTAEMLTEEGDGPIYLVLFRDIGPPQPVTGDRPAMQPRDEDAVAALERELRDTRERLQVIVEQYETTIEELRSANEEMVSVNEEAQSANEELETSKEEMQSVNEELQTLNAEINVKVEELDRVNSDLRNLYEATDIATVFLDRNLAIRSYTPAVTRIYSLRPADRGRPLADISARLDSMGLNDDIRMVLSSRAPLERRVTQDAGKTHYLVRILPSRNADNEVDGVLVSFIDITGVVLAEEQQVLIAELNHRVRNMLAVVVGLATQTVSRSGSLQAFREAFLGRIQALAGAHELLSNASWGDVTLQDVVARQVRPYMGEDARVSLSGPIVMLHARTGVALAMMVHELATNALKHGALSVPDGRVEVRWDLIRGDDVPTLKIDWRERGGPPAAKPEQQGFGTQLIARTTSYELGGEAHMDYAPDGLHAWLEIPLTPELGGPGLAPA